MSPAELFFALPGPSALSVFRRARLLARLQTLAPAAQTLHAQHMHFVHARAPLTEIERHRLSALLTYGDAAEPLPADGVGWLVVPRLGTVSPWASKATDIAHNCALPQVARIERGTRYTIGFARRLLGGSQTPPADVLAGLGALLHDRMTESLVAADTPVPELFRELPGKPLAHVPLRMQGRAALVEANPHAWTGAGGRRDRLPARGLRPHAA